MIDTNEFTKVVRGEVRGGVIRRRRWTAEEKGRIVGEAVAPDAVIAVVARRHDLTPQHLSNWIRAAKDGRIVLAAGDDVAFVPVIAGEMANHAAMGGSAIEIVLGPAVIRVSAGSDVRTLEAALRAVRRALS
jgi:transposase